MHLPEFMTRIYHRLTTAQRFVNGNEVLIIYFVVILFFFILDREFRKHMRKLMEEEPESVTDSLIRFYKFYQKHGFLLINLLLFIVCVGLTIYREGFNLDYLITILVSFVIFTILMKLFLRLFIKEDSYENGRFMSYLQLVCYVILGNFFAFFMPFVKPPNLLIAFIGLVIGLVFCLYIMTQAIFNPQILRQYTNEKGKYAQAYGILGGMLGVVVCIMALEYMMVYACYTDSPNFYTVGNGRELTGWDMLYYLVISFTTIGYGDISPVPYEGMFYSEFTAMVIGLSSMFTTACFVAAVISSANSLAKSQPKKSSKTFKLKKISKKEVKKE